jgi:hypothetical protein
MLSNASGVFSVFFALTSTEPVAEYVGGQRNAIRTERTKKSRVVETMILLRAKKMNENSLR